MTDETASRKPVEFTEQRVKAFLEYKFTLLFFAILVMIVISPLNDNRTGVVTPLFFLLIILTVVRTLEVHRAVRKSVLVFGLIAVAIHFGGVVLDISFREFPILIAAGLFAYCLFFFSIIVALSLNVFRQVSITRDTIYGGISVYLLMGILWAVIYEVIILTNPNAIVGPEGTGDIFPQLLYYSYTTLTTLGYGDIAPRAALARNLAILEALIGQIFMTVFIARLVGLYISGSGQSNK
jgi:hypothetical protein